MEYLLNFFPVLPTSLSHFIFLSPSLFLFIKSLKGTLFQKSLFSRSLILVKYAKRPYIMEKEEWFPWREQFDT